MAGEPGPPRRTDGRNWSGSYGESRKTSTGLFSAGLQNTSGLTPAPTPRLHVTLRPRCCRLARLENMFFTVDTQKQPVESPTPTPPPPTPIPLSVTLRLQASCFPALFREAEHKLNKNGKTNKKRRLVYSMNHSSGVTGAFGEVISLDSISSARTKPPPPARFFLATIDSDSKMKHLRRLDQAAP